MDNQQRYAVLSLELNLFFARIMKEHALFLKAGFAPVDVNCGKEAEFYMDEFGKLLCRAISLGDGIIRQKVLCSGELLTEFTPCAEQQTQNLTGICTRGDITALEANLRCGENGRVSPEFCRKVMDLNQAAIRLLNGLIRLKEKILSQVLCCKMFTMNYPLLLEHTIREAKRYRSHLCNLERCADSDGRGAKQVEQFWNQIMMEHAQFTRGLLDPSEDALIETSHAFAGDYARLLECCRDARERTTSQSANPSLEKTLKFRDFNAAGAKGIQTCKIRSIILPLLADHVLREANHYIRLLEE